MSSLESWQPAVTSMLGLVAIFIAALLGFWFNRRRDAYLRNEEVRSIATALYAEVVVLRIYTAKMSNRVAKAYENQGLGRHGAEPFNAHFFEQVPMPEARIYAELSSQIGKLPAEILLGLVEFHSSYEEARYWLPRLEEREDRGFSYGVLWVLHPALNAIEKVDASLRSIEKLADICPPVERPDVKSARSVVDWEEELWEQSHRESD